LVKAQRGEHKVEFFTNLTLIRKRYDEGMVVAKLLYDELITAKKISMPYQSFVRYFRTEIVGKPTISMVTPKEEIGQEPLWLDVGGKKGGAYVPHTRELDPKDVIGIKKNKGN